MSELFTPLTLVAGLVKAEEFLGVNRVWEPSNPMQEYFLEKYFNSITLRDEMTWALGSELQSAADTDHAKLNQFMEERGFEGSFEELPPDCFGVVSFMEVKAKWLSEADETLINRGNETWAAFEFKDSVQFRRSKNHPHPIAILDTESNDSVFITVHDEILGLDIEERIGEIMLETFRLGDFEGVIIPCVDLKSHADVSFLYGLSTFSEHFNGAVIELDQARQANVLKMNYAGVYASSLSDMACSLGIDDDEDKPPLVIDQPFLIWISRPHINTPIITGWVSEEDWKDPVEF